MLGVVGGGIPAVADAHRPLHGASGLSPPIQIGGCGFCTGLGANMMLSKLHVLCRCKTGASWVQSTLKASRYSSVARPRSAKSGAPSRLELLLQPADAAAHDQAPAGQHVDGGKHLGGQHGMALRHHHDRSQQPQPLGAAGEKGQRGQLIEAIAGRAARPFAASL